MKNIIVYKEIPKNIKKALKLNGKYWHSKKSAFMKAIAEDNKEKLDVFFNEAESENINLFSCIYESDISVIRALSDENFSKVKNINKYGVVDAELDIYKQKEIYNQKRMDYLKSNGFNLFSQKTLNIITEESEENNILFSENLFKIMMKNNDNYGYLVEYYFNEAEIRNVVELVKKEEIDAKDLVEMINHYYGYSFRRKNIELLCVELAKNDLLIGEYFNLKSGIILDLNKNGSIDLYEELKKEKKISSFSYKIRKLLEISLDKDFIIKMYEKSHIPFEKINEIFCPGEALLNKRHFEEQLSFITRYNNNFRNDESSSFNIYMTNIIGFENKYPTFCFDFKIQKEIMFNRYVCFIGMLHDYNETMNAEINVIEKLSAMNIKNKKPMLLSLFGESQNENIYQSENRFEVGSDNDMYNADISLTNFKKIIDNYISPKELNDNAKEIFTRYQDLNRVSFKDKYEKLYIYVNKLSGKIFSDFVTENEYLLIKMLTIKNSTLFPRALPFLGETHFKNISRYLANEIIGERSSELHHNRFRYREEKKAKEELFVKIMQENYAFLKDEKVNDLLEDMKIFGDSLKKSPQYKKSRDEFLNLFFEKLDLEKNMLTVKRENSKRPERL